MLGKWFVPRPHLLQLAEGLGLCKSAGKDKIADWVRNGTGELTDEEDKKDHRVINDSGSPVYSGSGSELD